METNSNFDVVSFIIALLALFIALWETSSSRRHNRLSVRPHLSFDRDLNTKDYFWRISLLNQGIGPAVIQNFKITLDDIEYQKLSPEIVRDYLKQNDIPYTVFTYNNLPKNSAIMPGQVIDILRFEVEKQFGFDLDEKAINFARIMIRVEYQSFYKQNFFVNSSDSL